MSEKRTFTVRAQPLTATAFAPFGQVVGQAECRMELRQGEEFHLDVLSYGHRPVLVDHLNRHHRATQALVSSIPELRPVDGGPLENAVALEAFSAVLLTVNIRHGGTATLRLMPA